jgi:RNA polymerase sigma-70 factor (ECF subfamily)
MLGRGEPFVDPDCDAALARAAAKGSGDAIAAIYERHGGLIYRFSLRLSGDQSMAEEVTQEVFLALIKQAGRFDPARAELETWLCGIARNMIWKQIKTRDRWHPANSDGDEGETSALDDDPDAALSRNEAVALVRHGMEDLPLSLKEVIVLCEFEELTYERAAAVLGVPVGTVRSRLQRAKARLAQLLRGSPETSKGGRAG